MICWCLKSTPRPGISASRSTALLVLVEQLAISWSSLADLLLEDLQLLPAPSLGVGGTGLRSAHAPSASHNVLRRGA